jgi:SAM-dependent methyltransferase
VPNQDSLETQDRYRRRWLEYGYDPRTLGWNKDCQWVRFQAVFEGLRDPEFESVIDLGCGFGDMLLYLRKRGWAGRYLGVDLVPELIAEARRRHSGDPNAGFAEADFADYEPPEKYSLAVAIGVFNHRVEQGNLALIRRALDRMWSWTTDAVVCDFLSLSSDPDRRQPNLYYADPRKIYNIASGYSRRVLLHHAYMPFEFQIKIWHNAAFSPASPVFPPYRELARKQTEIAGSEGCGHVA